MSIHRCICIFLLATRVKDSLELLIVHGGNLWHLGSTRPVRFPSWQRAIESNLCFVYPYGPRFCLARGPNQILWHLNHDFYAACQYLLKSAVPYNDDDYFGSLFLLVFWSWFYKSYSSHKCAHDDEFFCHLACALILPPPRTQAKANAIYSNHRRFTPGQVDPSTQIDPFCDLYMFHP